MIVAETVSIMHRLKQKMWGKDCLKAGSKCGKERRKDV